MFEDWEQNQVRIYIQNRNFDIIKWIKDNDETSRQKGYTFCYDSPSCQPCSIFSLLWSNTGYNYDNCSVKHYIKYIFVTDAPLWLWTIEILVIERFGSVRLEAFTGCDAQFANLKITTKINSDIGSTLNMQCRLIAVGSILVKLQSFSFIFMFIFSGQLLPGFQ